MTLRERQSFFLQQFAGFLVHAITQGYEFTFGEAYRSPEEAKRLAAAGKGIEKSLHTQRLAVDVNVFLNGRWLQGGPDMDADEAKAWATLGRLWKERHHDCRWGGDFQSRDLNHFSMTYQGRA